MLLSLAKNGKDFRVKLIKDYGEYDSPRSYLL